MKFDKLAKRPEIQVRHLCFESALAPSGSPITIISISLEHLRMISKKSIFVLGAGAGVPYGFSTGGGLLEKARATSPETLMGNAALQIGKRKCADFQHAIEDNLLPSIDALLEQRKDLWVVGKRVIATLLYEEERRAAPASFETDWMSLIFEKMVKVLRRWKSLVETPRHLLHLTTIDTLNTGSFAD